ncbi:MAG: transcriptional repressor [Chloroflexi bacterium]|nr:transcriptional repressor [Chloroflexota bacterium]
MVDNTRQIIRELSEKGYRLTPQRTMVLEAIEASTNHISAEEIHSQIVRRYPHVNISTIYRTLDLLERLGLVTKTDLGGGRVKYHPAHRGRHHHLVCQKCGHVVDLEESILHPLKAALLGGYGFEADLSHLAIFGRCTRCK